MLRRNAAWYLHAAVRAIHHVSNPRSEAIISSLVFVNGMTYMSGLQRQVLACSQHCLRGLVLCAATGTAVSDNLHAFFRSRRTGEAAARQEECLLCILIALAVSNLIFCLTTDNASDYIYAVFFLICSASYVKVRWWLAMTTMLLPTCVAMVRFQGIDLPLNSCCF
jgi:hypothetical protein